MWPHLYTPTGLRVGAPQNTKHWNISVIYGRKVTKKRLKTIVIDRPTKKRFLLRVTVSEIFSFRRYERYESIFTQNDVFRKLCVMKLRKLMTLEWSLYDDFSQSLWAVFVFLTSEIPILEQKYQFHLTHCRKQSCPLWNYESVVYLNHHCTTIFHGDPLRYGMHKIHAFSRNCCSGVEISILDDAL